MTSAQYIDKLVYIYWLLNMDVIYRTFRTSDSKVVTEMIHSLYEEGAGGRPVTTHNIQKTLTFLDDSSDRGSIMVFEYKKNILGYAILIYFWSNEFGGNIIAIDELYVKKEYRSHGVASNFLTYLSEKKPADAVALQLEVNPKNKKARELYKRLGFKAHKNTTMDLILT